MIQMRNMRKGGYIAIDTSPDDGFHDADDGFSSSQDIHFIRKRGLRNICWAVIAVMIVFLVVSHHNSNNHSSPTTNKNSNIDDNIPIAADGDNNKNEAKKNEIFADDSTKPQPLAPQTPTKTAALESDFWPFAEEDQKRSGASVFDDDEMARNSSLGRIYTIQFEGNEDDDNNDIHNVNETCSDSSNSHSGIQPFLWKRTLGQLKIKTSQKDGGIMSLYRKSPWWLKPHFKMHDENNVLTIQPMTVVILGRDALDTNYYRLLMTLVLPDDNGLTTAYFEQTSSSTNDNDTISLVSATGGRVAFYSGRSTNPYQLFQDATNVAQAFTAATTGTDNPSVTPPPPVQGHEVQQHFLPSFSYKLGWCTWNAYYTNITGTKLVDGVKWFHSNKINVGWMIIDDGWQHTTNDTAPLSQRHGERLASLGPSPTKFGNQSEMPLQDAIAQLKNELGLGAVLAWHAMAGYWLGTEPHDKAKSQIDENSLENPESTIYFPEFPASLLQNDPSICRLQSIQHGVGVADDADDYLERYYREMTSLGLDGVKVDVQGIQGSLAPPRNDDESHYQQRHEIVARLHNALAKHVPIFQKADNNNNSGIPPHIIHCMCHAPEIFFRIPSLYPSAKPLMRASDDFFPNDPGSHAIMIMTLPFNSLLLGHLAIPDWDMFQTILPHNDDGSHLTMAHMHTTARAISGAPIYISDVPGHSNATLIDMVTCQDGTILPCRHVAQPTRRSMLENPVKANAKPLIIWNTNGQDVEEDDDVHFTNNTAGITSGILAIFNLQNTTTTNDGDENVETLTLRANEIESFANHLNVETPCLVVVNKQGSHGPPTLLQKSGAKIQELQRLDEPFTLTIPTYAFYSQVVTVLPILGIGSSTSSRVEAVPLGIEGKINSAGAVLKSGLQAMKEENMFQLHALIRGCGTFSLAVRCSPNESSKTKGTKVQILKVSVNQGIGLSFFNAETERFSELAKKGWVVSQFDAVCTPQPVWYSVEIQVVQ